MIKSGRGSAILAPLIFGVVVLGLWQLATPTGDGPPGALPAPSEILDRFISSAGFVYDAAAVSGLNALVGLVIGSVIGLVVAILASWARIVDALVSPLAAAAAAVPIVALAPAMYKMFSPTSEVPRRLVIAVVVFFPIYVNTVRGLRQVSAVHRDLMKSYAVGNWAFTTTVRLPGAVPHIFTALRIAAPVAVITEIVAEYFGGVRQGLGPQITTASQSNYALAWAYVLASIVLGLLFFLAALLLERLALRGRSATLL